MPFATNHRIISFTLYTIGFMGFVMSLKKGYLKQQFGLFCWVHMSLLLVVVSRYITPSLKPQISAHSCRQSLHHQQYSRRPYLVLGTRVARYMQ